MRKAAKIDDNQRAIVSALRRAGCVVQSLAAVGKGCPDLLLALGGNVVLAEVKDGAKVASKQHLTADQVKWHAEWPARVWILRNLDDAAQLVMWLRAHMERDGVHAAQLDALRAELRRDEEPLV